MTPTTKKPVDLTPYAQEVERGLPNERQHLAAAEQRQNFFDYDGDRWESLFKRDAESSFDFQGRPHRPSGFLRMCVEVLTEHLYSPGPSRTWTDPTGQDLLDRVYADNLVDTILGEADVLSTLNQAAAIQIDAGEGDFETAPITYRVWGKEQFVAWPDPDDPRKPAAICTRDLYDLRTRYRLWSDTEVWTYYTKRGDGTSGGRVAHLESREPHDYGCLPFTLVHYKLPVRDFDVSCPGEFLHKAEVRIDNRLNFLDESIQKHLNPIPVAEGVDAAWKPTLEPMRFIRMPLSNPTIAPDGGYAPGQYARLYFLQPQVDVAGAWADLSSYINQALRAARVPISAALIDEQPGVISGIALILAEAPLFKRARKRHGIFAVYEQDLARRTLLCAGSHYGRPELVASARSGRMVLGWPQPTIPVPTSDTLDLLKDEVASGFKSLVSAVGQWYGIGHDDAVELLKQIKRDNDLVASIFPTAPAIEQEEGTEGSGVQAQA